MSDVTSAEMNMGPQPVDALLAAHGISNHDVVAADATRGATHKAVGKARKGRRLTARMQKKILAAVNHCLAAKNAAAVRFEDLFNYVGP